MVLEEASRSIRGPEIRSLSGVIKVISKRRSMFPVLQCIPNPHSWKTLGELLSCRKSSELSTLDLSPTFSCQSTQMSLRFIGILFPPFVLSVCFVLFFPHRIIWLILDLFIGINERNEYKLCNINEQIKKSSQICCPTGVSVWFPIVY